MKARFLLNSMYLILRLSNILFKGNPQVALVVKNLPAVAADLRDVGSIPGLGRFPGGGYGNPLQDSCLSEGSHGQRILVV